MEKLVLLMGFLSVLTHCGYIMNVILVTNVQKLNFSLSSFDLLALCFVSRK